MKNILLYVIFLLSLSPVKSQKIIENPQTGYVSSDVNIKVEKVTLTDTATRINFTVEYMAGHTLNIPKETYIQPVSDTTKFFIKNCIGVTIGFDNVMPASGILNYTLIFPKLDPNTRIIDFGEDLPDGKKVYDIHLVKDNRYKLPDGLYGKWYNTKNSNLEYAFFRNQVVYNNEVWRYDQVKYDNNKGTISIKNGKQKHSFSFSEDTDSSCQIAHNTYNKDISKCNRIFDKTKYSLPILKLDTAIYSGYIKDFNDRIGDKTISLYINDIITGAQNNILAKINEDGYFSVKVPLYHPEEVYVGSPFLNDAVYLEPGKELFSIIDNHQLFFMGDVAGLNNDLQLLKKIRAYDYFEMAKLIVDMNPYQYKAHIKKLEETEQQRLDSIYQSGFLSGKAYQIKKKDIIYEYASHIMEYKWNYEAAYRKKHGLSQEEIVKTDSVPVSYYDFLNNKILNDGLAVIAHSYFIFINRLKFNDMLRQVGSKSLTIEDIMKYLDKNGYKYTDEEKQFVDSLDYVKSDTILFKDFNRRNGELMRSFFDKSGDFLFANASNNFRINLLDSALGIRKGLATDIMFAQDIARPIVQQMTPASTFSLQSVGHEITTPFIAQYINICNDQTIAKIKANKDAGGYFVNSTPNVEADRVFEAIMKKYEGKVVYVDFWATWCGPCLAGIQQIRPLKEKLKDKKVAFIYITDETSPLQTWKNMIPTIRGEHYRLDWDDWNYLASKFNITGIPHYVLVDTNGKVLNLHLGFMDNTTLQHLLEKYMTPL